MNQLNEQDALKYQIEYMLLPNLFYDDDPKIVRQTMLNLINGKVDFLLYIFDKQNIQNPYDAIYMTFNMVDTGNDVFYMVMIEWEDDINKINIPLSYSNIFITDSNFKNPQYYCIEKGQFFEPTDKTKCFICGINTKGEHLNYGSCDLDVAWGTVRQMRMNKK